MEPVGWNLLDRPCGLNLLGSLRVEMIMRPEVGDEKGTKGGT